MTFVFHAPQIIWVVLSGLGIIGAFSNHNKRIKTELVSEGVLALFFFFFTLINVGLTIWGGVFYTLGIPQAIIVIGWILSLFDLIHCLVEVEPEMRTDRAFKVIREIIVYTGLYYWAGFFAGH